MQRLIIQPRDVLLLTELGELGLLSADIIHQRYWPGATVRACQNRLRKYTLHGLVHVMHLDIASSGICANNGRPPFIYSLTPKGADVVEDNVGFRPPRVLQKPLKAMTLRHRKEIVMVRIAWDDACQAEGIESPKWVMEQDIQTRRKNMPVAPRKLYHSYGEGEQKVVCRPDAACLTKIKINTNIVPLMTFFEIDRSTEGQKQIRAKQPGYQLLLKTKSYQDYFHDAHNAEVRVMWVCKSQKRIEEMQKQDLSTELRATFRFTTINELTSQSVFRDAIWQNCEKAYGRIIPA